MKRLGRWLLVALALGGAGSCSSDAGTGPVAGVLTVSLTTPNAGSDGAIQFRFTGPLAPTSITAAAGLRGFSPPPTLRTPLAGTRTPADGAGGTVARPHTRERGPYARTNPGGGGAGLPTPPPP